MESLFNYFVAVVDPLTVFIGKERSDERNLFNYEGNKVFPQGIY